MNADAAQANLGNVAVVANQKGGVGKTTATLGIAEAVVAAGGKVLVVDMDQQRNATMLTDPQLPEEPFTVFDVVAADGEGTALEACYPSDWNRQEALSRRGGHLDVLPGDKQMTDQHIAKYGLDALMRGLSGSRSRYDLVLLDCPPATGLVVQAALVAATRAVLVTEPQHLSVEGLSQSVELLAQFNAFAEEHGYTSVELAGIMVNQFDGRRSEHQASLAEIREAFGWKCWMPAVPERAVVQKAAGAHYPLLAYPERPAQAVAFAISRAAMFLLRSFQDPSLGKLALSLGGEAPVLDDNEPVRPEVVL